MPRLIELAEQSLDGVVSKKRVRNELQLPQRYARSEKRGAASERPVLSSRSRRTTALLRLAAFNRVRYSDCSI